MTIAVMQPYLFPYLGYYQLVNAVDTFVFFDDVNYINKGWINRNNLLQQNQPLRFTVPLIKASQNKLINEIEISEYSKWCQDFLRTIEMSYKKAPHFSFVFEWLKDFLNKKYSIISELASESITCIASLLRLSANFKFASAIVYKSGGTQDGQTKVLKICDILEADKYINPKNGTELYNSEAFTKKNVALHFINMDEHLSYSQLKADTFVPNLSIIDVLMFNGVEGTRQLLNRYTLN